MTEKNRKNMSPRKFTIITNSLKDFLQLFEENSMVNEFSFRDALYPKGFNQKYSISDLLKHKNNFEGLVHFNAIIKDYTISFVGLNLANQLKFNLIYSGEEMEYLEKNIDLFNTNNPTKKIQLLWIEKLENSLFNKKVSSLLKKREPILLREIKNTLKLENLIAKDWQYWYSNIEKFATLDIESIDLNIYWYGGDYLSNLCIRVNLDDYKWHPGYAKPFRIFGYISLSENKYTQEIILNYDFFNSFSPFMRCSHSIFEDKEEIITYNQLNDPEFIAEKLTEINKFLDGFVEQFITEIEFINFNHLTIDEDEDDQ